MHNFIKYIYIIFAKLRRLSKSRLGLANTFLLLSFFTGVFGATAAIIIKNLVHFTENFLSTTFPDANQNYLFLVFPLVGILISVVLVNHVIKDNLSHGVSLVLKAIGKDQGKLRAHNTYSSMITSAITVGFGGSVGLEAPMVMTGSAFGSNLARLFNLNAKDTILLLACGCTAAIAAVFKAPIAAIVFAIELLMIDFTAKTILPLLISAATGIVLSLLFLGNNTMVLVDNPDAFYLGNIPFFVVLGIVSGLVSVYFMRTSRWVEKTLKKIQNIYCKALLGGTLLGLLIFLFPVFFGEGYISINSLISGSRKVLYESSPLSFLCSSEYFLVLFVVLVILFKVIATALTTSSGGVGGVFAPTLFIGAMTGFLVAESAHVFLGIDLSYTNFILVGMAGVMGGVMHAPVTAIFLTAELSSGYGLLIPLMITSAISYLTVKPMEHYSIYSKQLAEAGALKTHNKDKSAIQQLDWKSLIDNNILTLPISSTLREYTKVIAQSQRNIFVVIDNKKRFAGLLDMDDHREIIFQQGKYDSVFVKELMFYPNVVVFDTDTNEQMLNKLLKSGYFNLPVITNEGKYVGFVSKAKMLDAYKAVVEYESED